MKHSEARLQALPLKKKVDFSYITWRLQIRDARDAYWPIGKKKDDILLCQINFALADGFVRLRE